MAGCLVQGLMLPHRQGRPLNGNVFGDLNSQPWSPTPPCLPLWFLCFFFRPPLWSSGQFLATDPEARVRFPALPEKKVVGLERGAFSLVSTN
jgi:hypothetical protein